MIIPQKNKESKTEYIFTQGNIIRVIVYPRSIMVYFVDGRTAIYEGKLAEQLIELCSNSTKEFFNKVKETF